MLIENSFTLKKQYIKFQQNEELRRQLTAQQKLIEKHKENLQKCLNVNKTLLIEKVRQKKVYFTGPCSQNTGEKKTCFH